VGAHTRCAHTPAHAHACLHAYSHAQVWDLQEGREPWARTGVAPLPLLELDAFDAGVWALCCGPRHGDGSPSAATLPTAATAAGAAGRGPAGVGACAPDAAPAGGQETGVGCGAGGGAMEAFLLLAGSEEGDVVCWDLGPHPPSMLWRCCVAQVRGGPPCCAGLLKALPLLQRLMNCASGRSCSLMHCMHVCACTCACVRVCTCLLLCSWRAMHAHGLLPAPVHVCSRAAQGARRSPFARAPSAHVPCAPVSCTDCALQDYVGGLALTPCGSFAVAGAADGGLTLLDTRRAGRTVAKAYLDSPVRCVPVCTCQPR